MKTQLGGGFTLLCITLTLFSFNAVFCDKPSASNSVLMISVNSEITMATATLLKDALSMAQATVARLVILKMNTPGGEATSMQNIMDLFEGSEIPICAFVYPPGASAWSAGTYIIMSSHIAAMASGTTIGSCQPVSGISGEPISASKYLNAYAALMVHHAQLHSRNETAARLFVLQNINLGPSEALKEHVVELAVNDANTLLERLEGFTLLHLRSEPETLIWKLVPNNDVQNYEFIRKLTFENISKAEKIEYTPGIQIAFLDILLNPLVSSLLLVVGIFLLLTGVKTPGYGAEIAGGVCIFLALIAFGAIGITPGAVILFVVGALLVLAEIKTHIGVLAISGAICVILGSLLLFPSPRWLIYHQVSVQIRQFLVTVSICMSIFFAFLVYKVAEAKRRKIKTGAEALIGAHGVAVSDLEPTGEIRVLGEFWQAKSEDKAIRKGREVEVVGMEGLFLIVKATREKV
ncbi:MAG: nodulation protein NfeD [Candidatus Bathyarchaeia archaeon]